MFQLSLFRIRAFTAGNVAGLAVAIARGGLQFMLIIQHLLTAARVLQMLPTASQQVLTGRQFFPALISGPFLYGLIVVFAVAAGLAAVAGIASALRGDRYVHPEVRDTPPDPVPIGRPQRQHKGG